MQHHLLRLWAKTDQTAGASATTFHPLIYHILDVAAVADALLRRCGAMAHLAGMLNLSEEALRKTLVFCCALHDIGKCSAQFQIMAPSLWQAAHFGPPPQDGLPHKPHGEFTDSYLRGSWDAVEDIVKPGLLTDLFRQVCGTSHRHDEAALISAIAGHHGVPTRAQSEATGASFSCNAPFRAAAKELVAELVDILSGGAARLILKDQRARAALSWLLSAALPASDWIGSNQAWFPPVAPTLEPAAYWRDHAQPKAARALAASGLLRAEVCAASPARTLAHLAGQRPTPLQQFAFAIPLGARRPHFFLIEDATGAGKTEAAMALTHRLMAAGLADGFYFALPTMATANAMYQRLGATYRALFVDGSQPSLALAHGKAQRNRDFLASLEPVQASNGELEAAVGSFCSGWIADSRRKALLAQAGAGTIDQALMAALPLRYQSLRVFGISSKILIIDEVHAFDPFMSGLTQSLIELHAMLGGSVILMSATLPSATRQKLVDAFSRGCGETASPRVASNAYPLLTSIVDGRLAEQDLPLAESSARRVRVERLGTVAEAEALAVDMARKGAAVALIRSTVDAAIASFERIKAEHSAAQLFHARFLLDDRLAIENDVLARFGKTASPEARAGRILVATQVIEQSLDLDMDVLITDLGPIDLLIQRAGRLWRHKRAARPVAAPVLHVISPEPRDSDTKDWLAADLPEAKWVYEDAARLWLSARRLFDAGEMVTATLRHDEDSPAHVRRLVTDVYDPDAEESLNADLALELNRCFGGEMAKQNIGRQVALDPLQGYAWARQWESDTKASSRLELKPRVTVRLARRQGDALVPLGEDWSLSELRLTQHAAQGLAAPNSQQDAALRPVWAEADRGVRLLVLRPDASGGFVSDDGAYRYDSFYGLRIGGNGEDD